FGWYVVVSAVVLRYVIGFLCFRFADIWASLGLRVLFGVAGERLPGSYVFDGRILFFPLAGRAGRYLYRARSGHVRAVWFLFVLRGTCWGCLSRDGEGAGLFDGFFLGGRAGMTRSLIMSLSIDLVSP